MKPPKSLQPYRARMEQRAKEALLLPEAEQVPFFYCGGRSRADFKHAVECGEPECVELALDVLSGEVWLKPGYARGFRAALRRAAGKLSPEHKKRLYALEMCYLERMEFEAYYTLPSDAQQRALRRIPGQRKWMQAAFGELPELTHGKLPVASPPVEAVRRLVAAKVLPCSLQESLPAASHDLWMVLLHNPESVLPEQHRREALPEVDAHKGCYWIEAAGRWVLKPWSETVVKCCGFALAADGSFYCCRDEWGGIMFGSV